MASSEQPLYGRFAIRKQIAKATLTSEAELPAVRYDVPPGYFRLNGKSGISAAPESAR